MSEQWRQELQPTPDCIAIERLGEARTEAEQQHVAACPRCQAELALFASFQDDESTADSRWIAAELHRRSNNLKTFRPRVFAQLAAAAAILLVIGLAVWMQNREPAIDTKSATPIYRAERVEAVSPKGDVAEAPRALRWRAIAGASGYTARILEVDRTVLWTGETRYANITLPADVASRFAPGKTLLWDVTARRGGEVVANSGMQRFRVSLSGRTNP